MIDLCGYSVSAGCGVWWFESYDSNY